MKKFILGLICGIGLTASTAVFASPSIQALLFPAVLQFHVNGEVKKIDGTGENGVLNYNNKAYVPLRLFAETTGATVDYRSKSISDPDKPQIDVYLGSDSMFTVHDSQGYISIGDIETHFTPEQKTVTGLLKVNKPFTTRNINLSIKTTSVALIFSESSQSSII
ncbi:hypothetical protein [Paenibacillus puerhi]|uniref:hypothetical protein n=1 Tax=Paenibacillus puerhi TaxID=2692622 RepID=UPI00135A3FBD|nr:hypothetical protein [Paenibacillus puerhi]